MSGEDGGMSLVSDKDAELLAAYLADDLSAPARLQLETRLEREPALQKELNQQQRVLDEVRRLPLRSAPRNFTLSVEQAQALRQSAPSAPTLQRPVAVPQRVPVRPRRLNAWSLASAAAVVLVVMGGALAIFNRVPSSNPASGVVALAPTQTSAPAPVFTEADVGVMAFQAEIQASASPAEAEAADAALVLPSPLPSQAALPSALPAMTMTQSLLFEAVPAGAGISPNSAEETLGGASATTGMDAFQSAMPAIQSFTPSAVERALAPVPQDAQAVPPSTEGDSSSGAGQAEMDIMNLSLATPVNNGQATAEQSTFGLADSAPAAEGAMPAQPLLGGGMPPAAKANEEALWLNLLRLLWLILQLGGR